MEYFSNQGSFKKLSHENLELIKEFTSDKVQAHLAAALIKSLSFRQARFQQVNGMYTFVYAQNDDYFIAKSELQLENWAVQHLESLNFHHAQFDERNFPQHFDIQRTWDNMRQQDETEAMGNEDTRSYPSGMPPSDTQHGWGWL